MACLTRWLLMLFSKQFVMVSSIDLGPYTSCKCFVWCIALQNVFLCELYPATAHPVHTSNHGEGHRRGFRIGTSVGAKEKP